MAADTANQKVFVPLSGVLRLQDEVRRVEAEITYCKSRPASPAQADELNRQKVRHHGLKSAVEYLNLPIEVRSFN